MIAQWGLFWILCAPALHFLLSACVGSLVYWLIGTMWQRGILELKISDSSIHLYLLSLGLSFAVLVHVLEDYTLGWF